MLTLALRGTPTFPKAQNAALKMSPPLFLAHEMVLQTKYEEQQ